MTTTELISQAWTKAEGEVFADGVGSDNWNYMFTLANYYIPVLATQYGIDWVDLYDPVYVVGTVTATDTFDLDADDVRKLSDETGDFVRVLHTNGVNFTNYKVVPANQLQQNYRNKACAKLGASLKFSRGFVSTDPEFGGTIQAPIYGKYSLLTDANSTVPGINPAWFVCMIAYDVAMHDILRKDIAKNILAEAGDIFKSMKSDNNQAQENRVNQADLSFIGGNNTTGIGTSNPLDMLI